MKAEQFLVKVSIKGRERTQLWEANSPLGLGSPIRWVLERNQNGVFIRDLAGNVGEVVKDGVIPVDKEHLENGRVVQIPGARGKGAMQLRIQKIRPIPPAFAMNPQEEGVPGAQLSQLFAFAGVLRTVIGAQAMHSAYVAYAKGRPSFTVYRNAEGYKVKPLLNGVHLKFKGEEPETRPVGEAWQLSEEELLSATVTRGRYWWRFNLVSVPARIRADRVVPHIEERRFKLALRSMGSLLLALLLMTWLVPIDKKLEEPEPPKPVVKFRRPEPKIVNDFIKQKVKSAQKNRTPTQPVVAEKPSLEVAAAPLPKPVEAPVPKAKENVAPKAAAPSNKDVSKAKPAKPGTRTSKVVNDKVPTAPKIPPEVLREKQASMAAAASAKRLREALGGAALAMSNKAVSNDSMAPTMADDKGGVKGAEYAPTEVRAGDIRTSVSVGSIGGKNGGKEGGVGYAVGEHAKLKGQGGSLVSVQTDDSVVDEGLTKEEVGAVIHAHMSEVRYCHESSMLSNPKTEGKLVLQFGINPMGVVSTVSVQSSTLPERKLSDCVIMRLKTWKFPRPKGGINVSVGYPFLFKTLGKD